MPFRMSGDFEHPLPAVDRLSISEAVCAQVVSGRFDVLDHSGTQRLELGEGLVQVFVGIDLLYVGKVGTGFDRVTLRSLYQKFEPLVRRNSAFSEPPPEKNTTFLAPRLVAQISYQELTADGKLRQPVFLGLRDDKEAKGSTDADHRRALTDLPNTMLRQQAHSNLSVGYFFDWNHKLRRCNRPSDKFPRRMVVTKN